MAHGTLAKIQEKPFVAADFSLRDEVGENPCTRSLKPAATIAVTMVGK